MIFSKNDEVPLKKTVLIAPLDWGLGHAARCVPIIKELQKYPIRIVIAGDGTVESLLKQEFPQLEFVPLPGYKIKYSKNKRWFLLKLLIQFPGVLYSLLREHRWLNKVKKELHLSAVISDNRFWLFNRSIVSIYITHQLSVKTGNKLSDKIATQIHSNISKNYTQRWIPDFGIKKNLAGELSMTVKLRQSDRFLGCLSRFEKKPGSEITTDLLILISGPEPQRTIFESLLLDQLGDFEGSVLLLRGLPGQAALPLTSIHNNKIIIKNHLPSAELNEAIEKSALVISRSGYTTIMDMVKLGKKAILVPTPGQTEQEYLANYLLQQKMFLTMPQEKFHLKTAMEQAAAFPFDMPELDMNQYKSVIKQFAESL
ncbi:MAG TPA: glycosyltransferase [Ferruginibacter sp.]|nr:glycosyltransferase [Ferruginibacter sp.]HPH90269.1 glycosyltransferase [Ferruginibacter sp.]